MSSPIALALLCPSILIRLEEISILKRDVEDQYLKLTELGEVLHRLSETCPGNLHSIKADMLCMNLFVLLYIAVIQTKRTFLLKPKFQPHLLVVPPEQVLKAALSLYMEDKILPMPTPEEMLICDHQTTSEEVSQTDN